MAQPHRKYTPREVSALRRRKLAQASDLDRDRCAVSWSLSARERDEPGTVWPPRPSGRYRMPRTRFRVTAQIVDLVLELTERGYHGAILRHQDLAELSRYSKRTVEYAVGEALALGLLLQHPCFEPLDPRHAPALPRAPGGICAGRRLKSLEQPAAYELGPAMVAEVARARRRAVDPKASERLIRLATARERSRKLRERLRTPLRSNCSRAIPEEAPEEAPRACARGSVSPAGTESKAPAAPVSVSPSATVDPSQALDPPLELRNSSARDAATPRARRGEGTTSTPRRLPPSQMPLVRNTRPAVKRSPVPEGDSGGDIRDTLERLRKRFAPDPPDSH